jgi:uncharacterized protein YunC (DUF1805 family)
MQVIQASTNKQAQSLCSELNMEIQETQLDIQVTKMLVEGTQWELKTKLVEVETQAGHGGDGKTVIGGFRVKLPTLDGPMSWAVFLCWFVLVVGHNTWAVH